MAINMEVAVMAAQRQHHPYTVIDEMAKEVHRTYPLLRFVANLAFLAGSEDLLRFCWTLGDIPYLQLYRDAYMQLCDLKYFFEICIEYYLMNIILLCGLH